MSDDNDDKKHLLADEDDESGELDPLGEDQDNKPLDIDESLKQVGLESDEGGPKPLNSAEDLDVNEENS